MRHTTRSVTPSRRKIAAALVGLGVVLTTTACGSEGDASSDSGSGVVRATVVPGVGSLPFRVAVEEGYFEANGLDVEVTEGYDVDSYMAALDRQFDAVMMQPFQTIPAAAAGLQLKAYGGMEALVEDKLTNPVIVKDPSITSLADLAARDGTLAVAAVTPLTTAMLNRLLEGTDYTAESIKAVQVNFPDMPAQLEAGKVDAIMGAVGFFEPLLEEEGYHVIAKLSQDALALAGAQYPLAAPHFVSSAKYVEENADSVGAFQRSIEEGIEWIEANPDEALDAFAAWTGRDPNTVSNIVLPDWKPQVTAGDFDPWQVYMTEGGMIDEEIDAESLVVEELK